MGINGNRNQWSCSFSVHQLALLVLFGVSLVVATDDTSVEQKRMPAYISSTLDDFSPYDNFYSLGLADNFDDRPKREDLMPGVLRFGKRAQSFVRFGRVDLKTKKEMPGVLRFGKRDADMPGVLRFGKRDSDMPGVLRFGKRDADVPGVLRFGKKSEMPGVLRFGRK